MDIFRFSLGPHVPCQPTLALVDQDLHRDVLLLRGLLRRAAIDRSSSRTIPIFLHAVDLFLVQRKASSKLP
eukprot:16054595-Heterocapsa_arctica.AAC.1